MLRILTSDILPVDVRTSLKGNPQLQALVDGYHFNPSKNPINEEQYRAIHKAIWREKEGGHEVDSQPAGPAATIVMTLNQLSGGRTETQFIGTAGSSKKRQRVLERENITLLPPDLTKGKPVKIPVTFVLNDHQHGCVKATYSGNITEFLKPDVITDGMVENTDAVLVMGSLWQRADQAFPDKLVDLAEKHGKEIWMTLPTHADYAKKNASFLQRQTARADLLLGNDVELSRVYQAENAEEAFRKLQDTFKRTGKHGQTGFITCGPSGAVIITAKEITYVPSCYEDKIVNEAGAGDTAFAGFIAGHYNGLDNRTSAQIGMALAHAKLRVDAPRLEKNAREVLRDVAPNLAEQLFMVQNLPFGHSHEHRVTSRKPDGTSSFVSI